MNALSAICVGINFGIPIDNIQNAIYDFRSVSMRMELKKAGPVTFIDDSYNSNPQSMKCAIWVLTNFKTTLSINEANNLRIISNPIKIANALK